MPCDVFFDLETRSPVPIKHGTHAYAEKAEVMLWAYADEDGDPRVWDKLNSTDNYEDVLTGEWVEEPLLPGCMPPQLGQWMEDPEALFWGQNGGMFDFVVLAKQEPWFVERVPMSRWRDTMVQAFAHSLPGSLEKLGVVLKLVEDDRKMAADGKRLIRLFCIPKADGTYNDKASHPREWQQFIVYAARDITTMRAAHRLMPMWNYRQKQVELWHRDLVINSRGFCVDQVLATKAIEAAETAKKRMAKRTVELTDGNVESTTQRDALLAWILESYGVELPDMKADTLERRMDDPDLPPEVKELLGIRLRASMNSVSKYKTLLRAVSADGRLRGTQQFRGASRTGRTAHRLFQPGNLPRPAYNYAFIEEGIHAIKAGCLDLVVDNEMEMCASAIRGAIVASPGHKLVVSDLSNIEGRVAAWLAGEDWKLQAFRDYDTILGEDEAGKKIRKGVDLYVRAYMGSFNVASLSDDEHEAFLQRQIGKVQELMFQFEGGVGAWITGAATYGIDLDAMTEAVYGTLPADVVSEAESFLAWLYEQEDEKREKRLKKLHGQVNVKITAEEYAAQVSIVDAETAAAKIKARFALEEKVFVTCDALKRLWRRAHPRIESYWKELRYRVTDAINQPGVTFKARRLLIRRDGSWLRIVLPSGRALAYPSIHLTKDGKIAYTGQSVYTRQWCEVTTYGGKIFENIVQAVANDQFMECLPAIEDEGYAIVLGCHDEWVADVPDTDEFTAQRLAELMVAPLAWNAGLPLAAAGDEMVRYHKT